MLDGPAARTEAPLKAKPDRLHARVLSGHGEAGSPSGTAVLSMLRRRMPLLFASIVLVPLLTYIAVGQLTPLYSATGTLLYDDSGNRGKTTGTGMPCAPECQKPGNKMLGFAPINRGGGVL